jgi:hypothetical protein
MKPSVTVLLGLLDKPALMNWANKIGLQGVTLADFRKRATNSGTSIHNQIEAYLLNGTPFEDPMIQQRCEAFFLDKEVLEVEKKIETEHFTGRLDLKIRYNGEVYVCDFKSSQKYIYLENKLQLAAYRMAEPCDKVAVISVPDFTFMPVEINDYWPYEQILMSLSKIHEMKTLLTA